MALIINQKRKGWEVVQEGEMKRPKGVSLETRLTGKLVQITFSKFFKRFLTLSTESIAMLSNVLVNQLDRATTTERLVRRMAESDAQESWVKMLRPMQSVEDCADEWNGSTRTAAANSVKCNTFMNSSFTGQSSAGEWRIQEASQVCKQTRANPPNGLN